MVIASKATSIGMIIISFAIGFISFYIFSDLPKKEKKKYIEALISQFINFIIFIWIGKILLNLTLFIQDPLVVLAYPGDSEAFYLAVLFTAMIIIYQSIKRNLHILAFAEGFAHVFLMALFFYAFFQMILEDDLYALGNMIVSSILLIIIFVMRGRMTAFRLLVGILTGWTIGMLVLSFTQPFVAVFGYLIDVWFIIVFFIGCLAILMLGERKEKS